MPRGDLVIGVDCSTTAAKAVVWNAHGVALSEARSAFELSHPRPTWAEQNPEDWWTATRTAIRRAVQTVDRERIAAICITHQRETFACLDRTGQPLRPAMIWADTRATEEVQKYGTAEVHTGHRQAAEPDTRLVQAAVAGHPRARDPRPHRECRWTSAGFLVNRLTGEFRTSWASADPLGVVDLRTFDYADDLLATAGLHRDQFAELVAPGDTFWAPSPRTAARADRPAAGAARRRRGRRRPVGPIGLRHHRPRDRVPEPGDRHRLRAPSAAPTPATSASGRWPRASPVVTRWRPSSAAAPTTSAGSSRSSPASTPRCSGWTCRPSRCWRRRRRCCPRAARG